MAPNKAATAAEELKAHVQHTAEKILPSHKTRVVDVGVTAHTGLDHVVSPYSKGSLMSALASSYFVTSLSFLDNTPLIADPHSENATVVKATIATLVVATLIALLMLPLGKFFKNTLKQSYTSGSRVLIVGPSSSGKTLLWYLMKTGTVNVETVTSSEMNVGTFAPDQLVKSQQSANTTAVRGQRSLANSYAQFEYMDIPGHPSLQLPLLQQYLSSGLRGILFVVPSTIASDNAQLAYAGQLLYTVLTSAAVVYTKTPIQLIVNHMSFPTSDETNKEVVRRLEQMIEKSRKHSGGMTDIGDDKNSENKPIELGKKDQPFSFKDSVAPVWVTEGVNVKERRIGETTRWLSRI